MMSNRIQLGVAAMALLALVVAIVALLSTGAPETRVAAPAATRIETTATTAGRTTLEAYDARLQALTRDLDAERRAREELETEVVSLRGELARVQRVPTSKVAVSQASAKVDQAPSRRGPRPVDVEALVAAGFDETTVQEFKDTIDQMQLDRLYLRDIAAREGWLDTPRFREESEALQHEANDARAQYGEEFYDWMLYTTGHPNRVRVSDVMSGSAAEDVGLRSGDLILGYDGERVFAPNELREATAKGEVGALTPVEVVRDGRRMRVLVPRGPLGVRVDMTSIEPQRAS